GGAALAPDAIFRLASMTKPITSLAVMLLADDGALDVDGEAARYLPDLARLRVLTGFDEQTGAWESRPPARPVTIRDLLTHTSGITYAFLDPRLGKIDDGKKARADVPLLHDPGARFSYGPGTEVLSSIVAAVSGQSIDDFCRTRIFEPLEMVDTGYAVPAEKIARVVTMQTHEAQGFVERPNPPVVESKSRGHDGLLSTASDYGKFIQLFLNGGAVRGRRLAREATVAAMMSNQIGGLTIGLQPAVPGAIATPFPIGGEKDVFGFGLQIETPPVRSSGRSAGSAGWSGIFNTYFWIDPVQRLGVTVLMQFLPAHDAGALAILDGVDRLVYGALHAA
ncbi:MAG TPA: serine hydrolase domain-containing protein, partial [Vicinamibacterales bacterium]|nr:serine hydrolase domain-containing protein [Vicinamibacterales bacterium]